MKKIIIAMCVLLTACNSNTTVLINSRYECPESTASNRAAFIHQCVVDLKDSIPKCEALSERLYCSEHPKLDGSSKSN